MAIAIQAKQYNQVYFDIVIIICHVFVGTWLSCYVLEHAQSYKLSYAIISGFMCFICFCVDLFEAQEQSIGTDVNKRQFFVAFLAISMGAMMHWCSKVGFVTMFITSNLQKLTEAIYRLRYNFYQGGAKLRGDATSILFIIIMFFGGAIFGAYGTNFSKGSRWTLLPITISYPFHLWLGGCLPFEVGYYLKRRCCPKYYNEDEEMGLKNETRGTSDVVLEMRDSNIKSGHVAGGAESMSKPLRAHDALTPERNGPADRDSNQLGNDRDSNAQSMASELVDKFEELKPVKVVLPNRSLLGGEGKRVPSTGGRTDSRASASSTGHQKPPMVCVGALNERDIAIHEQQTQLLSSLSKSGMMYDGN